MKIKKTHLEYIGFGLPLLLALICILVVSLGNRQASLPLPMPQEFVGEYSYDGENWFPLTDKAELSALDGELMLRGHLLRDMQEGWRLNFYRNHIGISIYLNEELIYMDTVAAVPDLPPRVYASVCSREWCGFTTPSITAEDTLEIRLQNPHLWGNRTAYRDFLTTLCSDSPGWNILEQNLEPYGAPFRVLSGLLTVASLMLLGAAIAAAAVHVPVAGMLVKLGLLTLFTAGFIVFDTLDVSFWCQLKVLNTYGRQLCVMLAMFCLGHYVADYLTEGRRRWAKGILWFTALFNGVLILLSFTGVTVIYDTYPLWALSQLILCPLWMLLCLLELRGGRRRRLVLYSAMAMLAAVFLDMTGAADTIVWRSPCSKVVFAVLFVIYVIACAREVVQNHWASLRAEKLEKELEDSRIAIMLSQIKPHFLYNVLNTIYHLYRKEPETAQEAVSSFAEYLRCNMSSIEKRESIPFTEEYQHIQTYLSLEQIRFRGKLDVVYDVEVVDFRLPALTVEPLVENAVKHGVTKKRGGGTVTIATREEPGAFVVTVSDTGVGFDPDNYAADGKPHIGIRSVRERLQSMTGGSLTITSTPEGTVARVTVPAKEARSTK